jgi:hypothetical protein
MSQKKYIFKIKIKSIENSVSGELSDVFFRKCSFCEKDIEISNDNLEIINKLSGPDDFYCSFCLRHNFHHKNNRNILILSFKNIISYFYFQNHLVEKKMCISEIKNYLLFHQKIGEKNPVFSYDYETMLWFINFEKIGSSKRKISLDLVLKTIFNIILSFDVYDTIPEMNISSFYQKYKFAIDLFYRTRHRPKNRKILIPNFKNTGISKIEFCNLEKMKNFHFNDLKVKNSN